MASVARSLAADSDVLAQQSASVSDGGYLLKLLALEILLKAVVLADGTTPARNHEYTQLFDSLKPETRARLVASADERMLTVHAGADIRARLADFGKNFVALRYSYEAYDAVSAEAYKAAGNGWLANGAHSDQAVFEYFPEELEAIVHALNVEATAFLARSDD